MLILTIKTNEPEAEVGLFDDYQNRQYLKWPAHRELAETIHQRINELLEKSKKSWQDIGGVVSYKGPGSFTGLRIGLTVANVLASTLDLPIAGTSGGEWLNDGIKALLGGVNQKVVLPNYGAPAHITKPSH